ncbi:hypothetical protein PGTUg99_024743 [Puccinia graminis f. sp. tritici]|uniref:Uncharacterized protein n=1 Tax=Puccinia graminis f. sp. tritici TaxID=56615 RepID=A0A5B0PJH7_PUCGR|nr:hypothetical protein PGTUg99_024743 [Puccinia graminis f. sp. tritici]
MIDCTDDQALLLFARHLAHPRVRFPAFRTEHTHGGPLRTCSPCRADGWEPGLFDRPQAAVSLFLRPESLIPCTYLPSPSIPTSLILGVTSLPVSTRAIKDDPSSSTESSPLRAVTTPVTLMAITSSTSIDTKTAAPASASVDGPLGSNEQSGVGQPQPMGPSGPSSNGQSAGPSKQLQPQPPTTFSASPGFSPHPMDAFGPQFHGPAGPSHTSAFPFPQQPRHPSPPFPFGYPQAYATPAEDFCLPAFVHPYPTGFAPFYPAGGFPYPSPFGPSGADGLVVPPGLSV